MASSTSEGEAKKRKPFKLQRAGSTSGEFSAVTAEETAGPLMVYRSVGLGLYGAALRFLGMPLERIALISNSTQGASVHDAEETPARLLPRPPWRRPQYRAATSSHRPCG